MKEYMTAVIGSAVLSALAQLVSPQRWAKYVRLVCGIMIVSVIASPIAEFKRIDIFDIEKYNGELDINAQKKAVISEMERKVAEDISVRIAEEFSEEAQVGVRLCVNDKYEIEGVDEISVWISTKREKIRRRLSQIYSPEKISFHNPKNF